MGDAMDWYEGNNGLDQDNGGHSFIRTQWLALGTDDDLWAKAQIVAWQRYLVTTTFKSDLTAVRIIRLFIRSYNWYR